MTQRHHPPREDPPAHVVHAVDLMLAVKVLTLAEDLDGALDAAWPDPRLLEPGFGTLVTAARQGLSLLAASIAQSWVATGYAVHCPCCGEPAAAGEAAP